MISGSLISGFSPSVCSVKFVCLTQEIKISRLLAGASLVAQLVKNPSAMWKTWVRSLGWEDPLEKGTATHPRIQA